MLYIKNLNKKYGKINVLNNISLKISNNDFIGLVGPNGVGKTTLIGCISGTVKVDSGDILLDNKSILKNPRETKQRIGVCFQDNSFDRFFNIYDTIKYNAMYNGLSRKEAKNRANEVLKLLNLSDKTECYGNELSGGMKKRFQIAQAIVHNPDLIILDEPSAGVDIQLKEDLYDILTTIHSNKKKTIILVSHYLEEIKELCNRVIFIKKGKIAEDIRKNEKNYDKNNYLENLYKQIYSES